MLRTSRSQRSQRSSIGVRSRDGIVDVDVALVNSYMFLLAMMRCLVKVENAA